MTFIVSVKPNLMLLYFNVPLFHIALVAAKLIAVAIIVVVSLFNIVLF